MRVSFKLTGKIGRLIGRDVFSGKDVREISTPSNSSKTQSLSRPHSAKTSNKTRKISYSLIVTSSVITEGTKGNGRLQAIALQIHPLIMESMWRDHFIILNWPVIAELPPLSATPKTPLSSSFQPIPTSTTPRHFGSRKDLLHNCHVASTDSFCCVFWACLLRVPSLLTIAAGSSVCFTSPGCYTAISQYEISGGESDCLALRTLG